MSEAESLALARSPAVPCRKEDAVSDKIVSIGLLTARDLELLGQGFRRHFPIRDDDLFKDLLAKLDELPARPDPRADGKR
ncbi:hypothetical protein Sj15T_39570 [Sphingobium sp. TA15]|uniref:Uncharacterized protein n=3 Tax=Sphingobium indicum TaxID=332055 RepID=D4Z735_SPHIU|nr:hypothetical protein K663_19663 [Sphingobium sp. MI1205]APL94995.1 hypothetical protein SIDU_11010 [Sphingobium indicum B90A]EPR15390.1 hypothetical protein M527_25155 [Sphingobium indicum IP26]EQB08576.1 hypothetical protein L286_01995 [Sphingobium sp. HDIP04]KEY99346.1 hypothetical protein AI27_04935 [Sphingomonas sp. BHC-A]MBY2930626.1 hypothetical protein [Sphingomonadales bacterium 56]MBY2960618.1 hypothetical protein [Sphingomonadales bacterium 58]RYM00321.1 hypothetical protein EWH